MTAQEATAMGKLIATHKTLLDIPKPGDIVNGFVLEKTSNSLYVDLGALGLGVIYGRELFDNLDTFKNAKIGDTIQATIQELDNDEDYIELSLRSATRERSWAELKKKLLDEEIFETEIVDANKGGLIVRVSGIIGFLPVSQLAPDHYPRVEGGDRNKIYERLREYVGHKFKVKVITANQEEEKLIVSEKSAIGDQLRDTLAQLGEGKIIDGVVSGVVDFGAFVKFEEAGQELEGLVHISELAWQRIDNPVDFVKVGDRVKAKVIGVDNGLRISLSIKQLQDDPWKSVTEKYNLGDKVRGEILKVTPFGAFVRLDKDIHGLVHISELPDEAQKDPESFFKVGDKKQFTIISLEPNEHRLGLSLRAEAKAKMEESKKEEEKSKKESQVD